MEQFDVIIVGGGPAGLECARELGKTSLSVLLLEKKEGFGDKLCAGGLTSRDMDVLPLPDHVLEKKILSTSIHSRKREAGTVTKDPVVFTVNRQVLGSYQRSLLDETSVEVHTGSQVVEIRDNSVVLKDGRIYGFSYLVGAEGYNSLVRRHLGLKLNKRLIGFQYTIPVREEYPSLEIHMNARWFSVWYAWIFPHKDTIAVGCCCDPRRADPHKIKAGFHKWLQEKKIDPGDARLETCPIACDYRGVNFGRIFLAGEAAGLASGFTGEGIYQSLVSGREVARIITDPEHEPVMLEQAVRYNRILDRVMCIFRWSGPFRGALQEFLLILMNREWLRKKINAQFTSKS